MDTNNQSSSGYILDIMKRKGRKIAAAVLRIEEQVTEELIEADGSPTANWGRGSFSDTFSPRAYESECQRQLNNVQIRVEPDEDEFARTYSKAVPIYPQNTTGIYDVQEMDSDVPKNTHDSEVTRRPREEKKKEQRKWLRTCIGLSIVIGASVVAYSYSADRNEHQSLPIRNSSKRLVNQHIRGGRFQSTAEKLMNNATCRFKSLIFSLVFASFVRSKGRLM